MPELPRIRSGRHGTARDEQPEQQERAPQVSVIEVSDDGLPHESKTYDATVRGHVMAAADLGHLWSPDATAGRVLRIDD